MANRRKLRDKVVYSALFAEFPALRYLADVSPGNIPRLFRPEYDEAMRILRIGPVADCWIYWKDWIRIADALGLRASVPQAVVSRRKREMELRGVCNLISSAYESPYPASDNPCRRITFRSN